MRPTRFLLLLIAFTLCFTRLALAQVTGVTNDQATPIPGVGHDYIKGLSETVQPASGQLSVRIDVPTRPGRSITLPYAYLYNSPGVHHVVATGNGHSQWVSETTDTQGSGWSDTTPSLSATRAIAATNYPGPPPYTATCTYYTNYVFQDPTGARHELPIRISQSQDVATHCNQVYGWPGNVLLAGDGVYTASTSAPPNDTVPQGPTAVTVVGPDGTVYSCGAIPMIYNGWTVFFRGFCAAIEDRNGNGILTQDTSMSFTTSSISVPWQNFSFNVVRQDNISQANCFGISNGPGTLNVYQSLGMPNGKSYQFQYDPVYGLLSKITYPTGGYVSYTWGLNPISESNSSVDAYGLTCVYGYDTPAVTHRYVSFDGVNVALQQDFTYSTTWSSAPGVWTSKQTTVTTHDLIRGNSFQTVYTYAPSAVESSVTYKDFNGNTLLTVNKGWLTTSELLCELKTLDNGQVSGSFYSYGSGGVVTDKKDYDFGQITSGSSCYGAGYPVASPPSGVTPAHETVVTYQSFPATPIFPAAASIFDRPSSVKTYGNGTLVAETDYSYDQSSVAVVSPSATNHDETYYSATSTAPRGNATTVTRKCLQACTDSVTTSTFDETGHVLTVKDPCGNTTCSDMTGTNHTTNYSYADSYTVLSGGQNVGYTPSGNTNAYLTKITDPLGHISNFTYDFNNGQLTVSKDQNGQTTAYLYNDFLARPTQINYPDGGKTTIAYNDSLYNSATPSPSVTTTRAMTSTTNLTTLAALDGLGHIVRSALTSDPDCTSGNGDRTDTTYTGLGQVYTVSNPYCTTSDSTYGLTTYTYDALGRTTQVTHPDNTTVLTTYTGRATQVQDEGNGTQRVTRISQTDGLGRLSSVCEVAPGPFIGANGASTSSLIGSGGSPVSCGQDIAGTGFLTTYQYDTLSNLLQVNQSGIAPRTFTYDSLSRLLIASNPESGSVSYAYDANGNLATKAAPLPNQTGTATVTTTYQFDALNRLTSKSYNDGSTPTVSFAYDTAQPNFGCGASVNGISRLTASSVPGWNFCLLYDAMGRLTDKDLRSPQNQLYYLDYAYDLLGNITSQTAGYGAAYYAYNTAGRPITVTSSYSDPNNPATVFSAAHYNAFGGLTSDTLGNGETESNTYTNRDWLASSSAGLPSGGTPTSGTGSVAIGGSEKSTQLAATAGTGTVTINGADRSTTWYPCGTGSCPTTAYDYGSFSVTVNGFTASPGYDQNSTSASIATTLASAFNSNSSSPVTATVTGSTVYLTSKATGSATNYSLSYSSATQYTQLFSGSSFSATVSGNTLTGGADPQTVYDAGAVSVTVNGFTATSSYGQTSTASSVASSLASALGGASSPVIASASGGVITLTAKAAGSATNYPLSVSVGYNTAHFSGASFTASASGATLTGGANHVLYSFNISSFAPNGDILSANDTANGNWTYTYDSFNRLVGANKNNGQSVYNYVYDRFGNRWQQNGPQSFLATFTGNNQGNPQNNNRMDGYSHDAAGNMMNDGVHQYTYDAENRLIKVDNGTTATYTYDADGNRVQKVSATGNGGDPAGTWQFLYDQSGRMSQRYNGTFWQGNIYVASRHLVEDGGGTNFSHSDWLGTERVRTNNTGAICESIASLPFGDGQTTTGYCYQSSPLHFTGKERDSESGLDNFRARYNSSAIGRFMSPDPAGMMAVDVASPQTLNRYAYVLNNPLSFIDPFGLDCVYLNSSGTGVEKNGVDQNSSSGECGKTGGYWVEGTVTQVNIDPNATAISLTGTTNGTNTTSASYQQDAVVTVGEYNNTSMNPYNHIALGILGQPQFGQNPRSDARFLYALTVHGPTATVPGQIKQQRGGQLLRTVRIRATGMQSQMLQNAMNQSAQNPPPYTVFGATGCDCGTWAQMMLGDAGINAGPPAPLPDVLMDQLNQLYPQQQQPQPPQ